jgi:hypothetical protein
MGDSRIHSAYHAGVAAHGGSTPGAVAVGLMLAVCLAGLVIAVIALFSEPPPDRRDGGEGDSGPGGGGGPGGGAPDGPLGGTDPDWWPEFERQFAEYITLDLRT